MKELIIKKGDKQITVADKEDVMDALGDKSDNTHGHGNLQNDGRVGTSNNASKNVVTDGSGKITTEAKPSIPVASSTVPLADTVSGSVGEGTTWAKADHTHKKSGIYAEANHTHNLNLNNLNIYADGQGGTNLIEGTQYFVGTRLNNGVASGMYQGCLCRRVNNTSGTDYLDIIYDIPDGTFKHGEKYTISFWAKGTGNIFVYNYGNDKYIKTKPINCTSGGTNTTNFSAYNDGNIKFVLTSDWKRYFVTWELNPTSDSTNDASAHKLLILRTDKNTDAYWAGVMYERGEIPHDWSPSPKDIPRENITASSTSIADLNDYKKAGFYYNGNNNEANYIIHCPNSDGTNTPYTNNHSFFLLVEDWGSNNYSVKQTLTYYDDDTIYIRRHVNGNWGTWKKTLNSSNYSTYALSNANGAVLNANIGNNQVNNAKLSDNAVSTSKIQDGAITNAKIASITDNKLTYDSNVYNGLSPIDMSMIDTSNANRLAFMPVANIQVKVSTNGGSTWSDYPSITNDMKLRMVSKAPDETNNLYSGGTTSASANNQIRIILDAGEITSSKNSDVYCSTGKKLMIAITANNASAPKVTVDMASYANPTSWVNAKTYDVGGWWGWNSIPFPYIFGGYQGQQTDSSHYRYIRLTFTHTGGSGNPIVKAVRLYTPISYISPSNYAKIGHIYSYDTNQNVTFPAKIIKNGGTSSQVLKANGDVGIVVNDLTTGGTGDVLSAEQGKWLHNNKAASTHTHSYLPLSGGTLTGGVLHPITRIGTSNTQHDNLVWAGAFDINTDLMTTVKANKSMLGTASFDSNWWSVISVRHRNGSGDGNNWGLIIKAPLTTNTPEANANLTWQRDLNGGTSTVKTILDSNNYSQYANKVTKTSQLTNDGDGTNVFVKNNDSRLSNARTPTSHTHGSIANGGTLNSDITSVNKVVVTDSSNNIKTISKLPASAVTHQDISGKADKSSYTACIITYTDGSTSTINLVTR